MNPNTHIYCPLYQGGKAALDHFSHPLSSKFCKQVLILDDGSKDGIPQKIRDLGWNVLHLEQNRGKAQAIQTAIQHALEHKIQWLITMDADGQHTWEDLDSFLTHCNEASASVGLFYGRRNFGKEMPWPRRCSNFLTSWFLSQCAKQHIFDSQCGYRAYRTSIFKERQETLSQGFQWESEILVEISRRGWTILPVPIRTVYGEEVSTMKPWRDTFRFLKLAWKILKN
jgi:glycosyltransferase involved in cell wall biosynthesis